MTRPVESYYDVTDTFAEFFCVDLYYIIIFSNAQIFTLGICPQNFLAILVNLVDYMQLTVLYFWVRLSWILNSISLQSWYKKNENVEKSFPSTSGNSLIIIEFTLRARLIVRLLRTVHSMLMNIASIQDTHSKSKRCSCINFLFSL